MMSDFLKVYRSLKNKEKAPKLLKPPVSIHCCQPLGYSI